MLSLMTAARNGICLSSPWPYRVVRWMLGILFIYAGIMKLTDVRAFADSVADFGLIYPSLIRPTSFAIPVLELLAGLGLLLDIGPSLAVITSLLSVFVAVLSYGLFLGLDIDCGCLGAGYGLSMATMWTFDLSLLGLCVYLHWCRSNRRLRPERAVDNA
jgi:uncharacterized membrane protein YphA (DoxX/SURF4 family)